MFSTVIPVYNEETVLRTSLEAVAAFLRERFGDDFEIVAVDDGSSDRSVAILHELASEMPLKILENSINLGKGATVRRGMLEAAGELVLFTDADLSTPLTELDHFLPHFEAGADAVIGTRKHADANIRTSQSKVRTVMGLGFTQVVNRILGIDFTDYTCGFKAFRREAAQSIFSRSVVNGWAFDAEIMFLSRRLGFQVTEVPVTWDDMPNSKVRVVRDTAVSLGEVVAIRVRAARGGYGR